MTVTVTISYNVHKYADNSDAPQTRWLDFEGSTFDDALSKFYDYRTEQNKRAANGYRKTFIGMLTSKCLNDCVD